jgi:hypothetical protein
MSDAEGRGENVEKVGEQLRSNAVSSFHGLAVTERRSDRKGVRSQMQDGQ